MTFVKDIGRLADGLSVVAKEAVNRQLRSEGGDLQSLIKRTLLSATDLTGLTKGKVRQYSVPVVDKKIDSKSNKHSVVYFTHDEIPQPVQPYSSHSPDDVIPEIAAGDSLSLPQEDSVAPNETPNVAVVGDSVSLQKDSLSSESGGPTIKKRKHRERKVPSNSFSRALGFAGLGAGLAWGTLQESAKRLVFGTPNLQGNQSALSPFLSEKNAERLALALCRMRGAALKLGQMLSIQDESLVPAPILAALDIVRQGADVMPTSQLNQVLTSELGNDWSSKLKSFDYEPMAAASIGQVHRAVTKDGMEVAMKIQYPGVADSIESDIDNVKLLLGYTNLIPEKLYLDNAMKVAKDELSRECDYELEAENQKRFSILLSGTKEFYVPVVIDDLSSKRVLTSELVPGIPIDKVSLLDQETRNYVGRKLLELTLMELFVFRFMQTDPNWSNFLYDESEKSINLIDFGAARDYPKSFVDDYLRMVKNVWFSRGGLIPLCLDHVLLEMYSAGELSRNVGVSDPASGRAFQIFQKVVNLAGMLRSSTQEKLPEDYYILPALLKEKALQVVQVLSESHWTSSCVVTWRKFQEISGGLKEARAVLNHLCGCEKAKFLVTNKKALMEGVKVSLSARELSGTTSLDFDVLHLIWTAEKLEHQLNVIDQRWGRSREYALDSLKSGNKKLALRCAREMKLASLSGERCTALLNRVEEVLRIIADAEATKEVSEAIRIGTQAIKDNGINVDEVELCLHEFNDCIETQKQIDDTLGSNAAYAEIDDEDFEDQLKKLDLNSVERPSQALTSQTGEDTLVEGALEMADELSNSLSNLHLAYHAKENPKAEHAVESMGAMSNDVNHEATVIANAVMI